MVNLSDLEEYLAIGHESRSFEVKGPGNLSDKSYCAKVARAVMAMGNLRDGGLVCLGIDDTTMTSQEPGLTPEQYTQWVDFDDVSAKMAKYADPPVSMQVLPFELSTGSRVVVLQVMEFDQLPHVCKQDYQSELRNGMMCVRPRGQPKSVPVPSSSEMREVLDTATDKGVREFVRRARAAGLLFDGPVPDAPSDEAAFLLEAHRAWESPDRVLQQITSRAHFNAAVKPGPFNANRLGPSELQPFIEENTVRLRGWPVPYIDFRTPPELHGGWIAQTIEPHVVPHVEAWRICESGQFLQRRMLATDLNESPQLEASDERATGAVAVWDVLLYSVELAELAARMMTSLRCESIAVTLELRNVAGRQLVSGDWNRELHGPYITSANLMEVNENVHQDELLAGPREVGVRIAQHLLEKFGVRLPHKVLMDWQENVLNR